MATTADSSEQNPSTKPKAEYRFAVLLGTLTLLFVGAPIARTLGHAKQHLIADLLITLLFVLVLLSAIFAISRSRVTIAIGLILAIPTAVAQGLQSWLGNTNEAIAIVEHVLGILFLGFTAMVVLYRLFLARRVTLDTICASLCVYLLLAATWALLYSLCVIFDPDAFSTSFAEQNARELIRFGGEQTFLAIYYSLVTMSTLGYGDIIPTSSVTRMLAAMQAIVGQLYLAVLVARLVGLHIASATMPANERPRASNGQV